MNISGSHPIHSAAISSNHSVRPPQLLQPPLSVGAPGGPNIVAANAAILSDRKEKMPDILDQLVNNFISTAKMTASALKTVGQEWASNIQEGNMSVLPRFIASTIGAALYSGSLIAGAAIKAALWLPIIGLTATAGFAAGFLAFIVSLGSEKAANQTRDFITHLVGWSLSSATALISGITLAARGPLWVVGLIGALCMTRWSPENQTQAKEQQHKLMAGLYQTLQDALILWSGGTENIWKTREDFLGNLINSEDQKRLMQLIHEMGANVYAINVQSRKYALSSQSEALLREVFRPDIANKLLRKD